MSIYENEKEYAEKTFMTLEQAKLRCEFYKKLNQEINDARKCPKCHQDTLEIESGEEGQSEYVYCESEIIKIDEDGEEYSDECDFTSDV